MYFGNSKTTLSPVETTNPGEITPARTNFVVSFIDESNPNYIAQLNGDVKGECWEKDVVEYTTETQNIPDDSGFYNYIVFDLLNWPAPIWPKDDPTATAPPIREEHIIEIDRPSQNDYQEQVNFFNTVVQALESRWGSDFWSTIQEENRYFIIIVDDSGSMTRDTINDAIGLLNAYAAAKIGNPLLIKNLNSCKGERWLKWGGGALNTQEDIGCNGSCDTSNIQFCRQICTTEGSLCEGAEIIFPIPAVVFECDDPNMENPIEYECPECKFYTTDPPTPEFLWIRRPDLDVETTCSENPNCVDGVTGNVRSRNDYPDSEEIWSPGWLHIYPRELSICGAHIIAGEEAGKEIDTVAPLCNACFQETISLTAGICGCDTMDVPIPCQTGGSGPPQSFFYKCVNCIYPNDQWDTTTWPPPQEAIGGTGHELCRIANCSVTAGFYFGEGTANIFDCDDCVEYAGCADCINEDNDAFTAHNDPGCNNSWLACKVGAFEPLCCDVAWDQDCVDIALNIIDNELESFLTQNYGWQGSPGISSSSHFGCTGYFADYKDISGNCMPCLPFNPGTTFPLYSMELCDGNNQGCTTCAQDSGFTSPDYSSLWVEPWNRCGEDCN